MGVQLLSLRAHVRRGCPPAPHRTTDVSCPLDHAPPKVVLTASLRPGAATRALRRYGAVGTGSASADELLEQLSAATFGAASQTLVALSGTELPAMDGKPGAQDVDLEDVFSLRQPKNVLSGASSGLQSVAKGARAGGCARAVHMLHSRRARGAVPAASRLGSHCARLRLAAPSNEAFAEAAAAALQDAGVGGLAAALLHAQAAGGDALGGVTPTQLLLAASALAAQLATAGSGVVWVHLRRVGRAGGAKQASWPCGDGCTAAEAPAALEALGGC